MSTAVTRYVTPALLALGVFLAIANWSLTPERRGAWAITLGLLVFLVVPLAIARRLRSRGILSPSTDDISRGVGFAAVMMVIALSGKLLQTLGVIDDGSLARRLTMALVGVLLAMIGNATPKRLTPLSALGCDGARNQAFQRFAGWTWFMAGLTFAMVWLVMPLDVAKPLSIVVIVAGMLLVATQLIRMARRHRREA
jgi:hypothetical protein